MKKIEYNPNLFISYDPNFLIIEIAEQEYIFYNSVRHFGCRISKLELLLLNVLYKYEDIEYIMSNMPIGKQNNLKKTLERLSDSQILSTTPYTGEDYNKTKNVKLKTFYIHLTYRCNLNCSYCYNKSIRTTNVNEISINEWKKIIDKIAPYASLIVLTGGECFLYKDILPLLEYTREKAPNSQLSCISNCMHDFSNENINQALNYFNSITFSCDSISEEGERIGFNPELFKNNIEYIKTNFPNINIDISKTNTINNVKDSAEFITFRSKVKYGFTNIVLNPCKYSDIEIMPPISDFFENDAIVSESLYKKSYSSMRGKKTRCGAAKYICSVDPVGNVYPCQSLHFEEFIMGNLLRQDIKDLRYQDEEECIPCVDEIPECTKCKVKYICGGGCFAGAYELRNHKLGHNKWLCPYNYHIAMDTLQHIKNNHNYRTK
ncbi:MAG: radical SAM protein [Culturomica sp.]|nr:radical SAM protein [Culturomica sp.]